MRCRSCLCAWLMLVFAMVVLIPGQVFAAEKYMIQFQPEPGDAMTMSVRVLQTIRQEIPNHPTEFDQNVAIVLTMKVLDVGDDQVISTECVIDRIAFENTNQEMPFYYDSAHPEKTKGEMGRFLHAAAGSKLYIDMKPNGQLVELKGLDEMIDRIVAEAPEAEAGVFKQMSEMFDEDSIQEMMKQNTSSYPDYPVEIGESWEQDLTMTGVYAMDFHTVSTLTDVTDEYYIIDQVTSISQNEETEALKVNGAEVTVTLSGDQRARSVITREKGFPVSGKVTQDIAGHVRVIPPDPNEKPIEFPMTIQSTSEIGITR